MLQAIENFLLRSREFKKKAYTLNEGELLIMKTSINEILEKNKIMIIDGAMSTALEEPRCG